jgi:hypothetical protein
MVNLISLLTTKRFPLYAFTPISLGGLGFSEAQIGNYNAARSIISVLVLFAYSPIEKRLGPARTYQVSLC